MDKAILKKFAIESRQDLMSKIKNKINTYYIDEEFTKEQKGDLYILSNSKHSLSLTNEEYKKRELLIKRIKELSLEQVIEEAAYTWFNRIIAIRYMEINDMLPLTRDNQSLGIRVLSSKDNTPDPEILKFTNLMNPELDIEFKKEKFAELKDDNEKFKYILLLVCKKLGRVIPQVFDGITDYIDILIPDNLLNDTGFIAKIINEVPEENYNQVEIIGWLYQYYNQTEKDRVISSKKAYKKNEIAYATQLFTPDWIVKYMVENSLGKYWLEHNENNSVSENWKYLIKENLIKKNKENPSEIKFIDPCCGSGHILVYAFEIFYQIYLKSGYNKNDISEMILSNNLYGLDIDDRAGQLSILSVILKAREYDKNIFNKEIVRNLNVASIQESNTIDESLLENIKVEQNKESAKYLLDTFKNAKEIGSLLILDNNDYSNLKKEIENDNTIFGIELRDKLLPIIKIAEIISSKYSIVVTNPPYMNTTSMSGNLKKYVTEKYKDYKYDLFSAFIVKNLFLSKDDGYLGFMTPYVWLFIQTYENLRNFIIDNSKVDSLIQLEYSALEEATVPICSFIINKELGNNDGNFIRLTDIKGGMESQRQGYLNAITSGTNLYKLNSSKFKSLPNSIFAYWISEKYYEIFNKEKNIGEIYETKLGMSTNDNDRFLRFWYEVDKNNMCCDRKNDDNREFKQKWFPYSKGGEFRKWYGNVNRVINWENNGYEVKKLASDLYGSYSRTCKNSQHFFKSAITWSLITSSKNSFRFLPEGCVLGDAGPVCFANNDTKYLLGFLNTNISQFILNAINPTLNCSTGVVNTLPIILNESKKGIIEEIVKENIELSKQDWDSFETSWDFKTHQLLLEAGMNPIQIDKEQKNGFQVCNNLKEAYNHWVKTSNDRYNKLKENEEKLNDIFIDIYGLSDELSSKVNDSEITIHKAEKEREIKSLISYAVGCMFGRYSLDEYGLIFAGGEFKKDNYKLFKADEDNIIPITDEAYFGDDIVERFKSFIKVAYGTNTFNENMDFIAEALGKKGTETSEDTIRRYFVNDFFNDHCKIYQKRPIYWLFDSGKKNGFKAIVYLHRYNDNLIPKIRLDYLHRIQTTYEKLLSDVNYKLTTELSMSDKKFLQNKQVDLNAKLQEIKEYDEKIAHIANQRISIDLDDGVKENYDKFKDILAKIK